MTDKQRADHVQAKYWGGPISRAEAQKIFDQYAEAIATQAQAIQKLDTVLTYCMKEKLGVTVEEVNAWVAKQLEAAKQAAEQTPLDKAVEVAEQRNVPNPEAPIVLTDAN